MLLVAAHEADHVPAGRNLDDLLEPRAHEILELHPLMNHRRAAAAVEQRLLDSREATAQHADDEVISVVGLRPRGAVTVELLQQRDHAVGDRSQHIAVSQWTVLNVT